MENTSDANTSFTKLWNSNSDGGVLSKSEFGKALYTKAIYTLYNSNLNLPQGKANLSRSNTKTSCFLIGDETVNDLMAMNNRIYYPPNFIDTEQENDDIIHGAWRNEMSGNVPQMERIRLNT
ncbi:PREDICTED: uncharacterized protein LOC108695200 [Atta colombica]|uniref:uncharacterized protein LOC108695200 n=1 Tax=Atta colombica TaxID=520822 RepID=UPI00084C58F6|nr:PREDICTED: uncharacterized protein LOC108695200 [Atta colombica]